jgi:hypothetical protein
MNPTGYKNVLSVEISPGFVIEVDLEAYAIHAFETAEVIKKDDLWVVTLRFKNEFRMDKVTKATREPVRVMRGDDPKIAYFICDRVNEALLAAQKKYAELVGEG